MVREKKEKGKKVGGQSASTEIISDWESGAQVLDRNLFPLCTLFFKVLFMVHL